MEEKTRVPPAGQVPLEEVLITEELSRRPSRPPDPEALNAALVELVRELATSPRGMLQKLVDVAVVQCRAHSAGVSLLEGKGGLEMFRWHAIAGPFSPSLGGTMPRDASPCGMVLDRDEVLLFAYPERRFAYEEPSEVALVEALLAPFHHEGRVVGTVWVLMHDAARGFDAEDARVLTCLAEVASAAYQALSTLGALREARDDLERTARALEDANLRKDRFLATLAHELRNPLAPILTALPVLSLADPSAPERRRSVDVIHRQVRQMARLIDDLLDLSRITHDRLELRRERVDLRAVVDSALETSRSAIVEGRHALTIALPEEPVALDADPTRLAQVLSNLLNNAAKYTPPGGRIALEARREGAEVVVSVTDDGMGIAPELLPRIFEMFVQEGRVAESARGGLGIGLSLARRLVELHGGRIEVHSAGPGRGSRFEMRLPALEERPAPGRPAVAAPAGGLAAASSALRVLIVDDNVDAAGTLEMLLGVLGHEVQVAHDGAEAVRRTGEIRPDVVLLDIGMPGMDGHEAARRIRALPGGDRPFLVAMTGWGQEEDRRRAKEAGFDLHMVKPVDPGVLARVLASRAAGGEVGYPEVAGRVPGGRHGGS